MAITDNTAKWQVKKITNFTDKEREIATQAQAEEGVDNTKIMTPLRVKNAIDVKRPMTEYTSVSQLGLTKEATLVELANALPSRSILRLEGNKVAYPNLINTDRAGQFVATKHCTGGYVEFRFIPTNGDYIEYAKASGNWVSDWKKLITTSDIATQAEAEAGTDNTTVMTPLRTKNAIDKFAPVKSVNGKTGDVVVDLPVGHMYWSVEPNVPAGRLPAMGATYNRALYADLWAWANSVGLVKTESEWQAIASANDGNCAYYSSGDGSTTFRVPKLPNTIASDVPSEVPVVGNGMAIGMTNGTKTGGLIFTSTSSARIYPSDDDYGRNIGLTQAGDPILSGTSTIGLVTDASKSGIVAKTSATKITGMWLIVAFGVAHNVGEADVANVMSAVEQVQTGLSTLEQGVGTAIDYIVESYRNGTEWYEVYKSGKVRQGGVVKKVSSATNKVVTFLKPFSDTNYFVYGALASNSTSEIATARVIAILGELTPASTTQFTITASSTANKYWIAEGQGA